MKTLFAALAGFALSYSRLAAAVGLIALALPCSSGLADEAAVTAQLETLGGTVVAKDGAVIEVSFRDSSRLADTEWRAIGRLQQLQKLTVYGGARGLNDETVGYLATLRNLESLSTDGAQLSDEGLAKLANITSLRSAAFFHLSFRKEGFTGKGFAAWKKLPNLERLTVAGMSMGDEGFAAIAQLQTLQELRTWHTYRTEASHEEIARLSKLTSLKLGQRLPRSGVPPCLTDQSLTTLVKIQTLESLEIGEARFTLEALKQLRNLPHLKRLKIDRTEIAAADIDALRTELPGVKVEFEPLTEEQRPKLEAYLK